jgi:hypothetical protein
MNVIILLYSYLWTMQHYFCSHAWFLTDAGQREFLEMSLVAAFDCYTIVMPDVIHAVSLIQIQRAVAPTRSEANSPCSIINKSLKIRL